MVMAISASTEFAGTKANWDSEGAPTMSVKLRSGWYNRQQGVPGDSQGDA
jgi:hypothetical protein